MPAAKISIDPKQVGPVIRPELYGHGIEHRGTGVNGGIWVGEDSPIPNFGGIRTDILDALRQIHPSVLRWPGGSFAADYQWEDGIGPRGNRPRRVNLGDGQTIEPNAFGTHEYIQVCRTLGAEPYLVANVDNGTVRQLQDWAEYCNFPGDSTLARRRSANGSPAPFGVRYWKIANDRPDEISAEQFAANYKLFSSAIKTYGGVKPFLIAGVSQNRDWAAKFFEALGTFPQLDALSISYSCGTAGQSATQFDTDQWYELLTRAARVEQLIIDQRSSLDRFDPQRKTGLAIDPWGAHHAPEPGHPSEGYWQQNTMRDALVAAITLDIFNRHSQTLAMCNIGQIVNVLQAMVLTREEGIVLTPTYHVFELYRSHQGGRGVSVNLDSPESADGLSALAGSASIRGDLLTLSVTNSNAEAPIEASIDFKGSVLQRATVSVLTDSDLRAHNNFENPRRVKPQTQAWEQKPAHVFPPASVTVFSGRLTW